jgi:hypothetical protein
VSGVRDPLSNLAAAKATQLVADEELLAMATTERPRWRACPWAR